MNNSQEVYCCPVHGLEAFSDITGELRCHCGAAMLSVSNDPVRDSLVDGDGDLLFSRSVDLSRFAGATDAPWRIVGEDDLVESRIDDLMVVASQVGPLHPPDGQGQGAADSETLYVCNVGGVAAMLGPEPDGRVLSMHLANARLIAAAPALAAEVVLLRRVVARLAGEVDARRWR